MVEWSLHIGEPCRQILEGHFSTGAGAQGGAGAGAGADSKGSGGKPYLQSELLVLCDKSLFLLKAETGGLIQQKRLERADASCMCAIPASLGGASAGGNSGNFMVAGQDATVQVYSGFNLGKRVSAAVTLGYWITAVAVILGAVRLGRSMQHWLRFPWAAVGLLVARSCLLLSCLGT